MYEIRLRFESRGVPSYLDYTRNVPLNRVWLSWLHCPEQDIQIYSPLPVNREWLHVDLYKFS